VIEGIPALLRNQPQSLAQIRIGEHLSHFRHLPARQNKPLGLRRLLQGLRVALPEIVNYFRHGITLVQIRVFVGQFGQHLAADGNLISFG